MPKNYFLDRPEASKYPMLISKGDKVSIITKELQGAKSKDALIHGYVYEVLSKGRYYKNGAKVKIIKERDFKENILNEDVPDDLLVVGRVQYIYF